MKDLEALRQIFKDNRDHIAVGKITKIQLASDRSSLKCMVLVYPESKEIVARMSWEAVGPEAGVFQFPSVNDMVLVAMAEGDVEQAFIIKRLTSKEDKIPLQAASGHTVIKALLGKHAWLTSDTKILLSKGDTEPDENLVLGRKLKSFLIDLLTLVGNLAEKTSSHTHAGNLGYPTSQPNETADFILLKQDAENLIDSPVNDDELLSDIAFTEKGN